MASSRTPGLPPLAFDGRAEGMQDEKAKQRSWWKPASRRDEHQAGRSASIRTTSTVSSANSVFSKASSGSRVTAASSNVGDCTSPISPISETHGYDSGDDGAVSPITGFSSLSLGSDSTPTSPPAGHLPQLGQRPKIASDRLSPRALARAEPRLESRAGHRTSQNVGADPIAEVEMMPRKYAGYWRASFTANLPISAAMCGCLLMVAGPGESSLGAAVHTPALTSNYRRLEQSETRVKRRVYRRSALFAGSLSSRDLACDSDARTLLSQLRRRSLRT